MDDTHADPKRFRGGKSTTSADPESDEEISETESTLQEVTLKLLTCEDWEGLGHTVREVVKVHLPLAKACQLYYIDGIADQMLLADAAGTRPCIAPDCAWKAYRSGERVLVDIATVGSAALGPLKYSTCSSLPDKTPVLCAPVRDLRGGTVIAILMVALDHFSKRAYAKITWLEKQIAACYNHIQRTFQSSREQTEERATQAIIKLCGELYDQDAVQLQLKVVKFLEEQTQAECAFLLLVVPDSHELFCQVIGKTVLQSEIRFPGQSSSFAVALETKQPISLEDIPVENRKGLEDLLERPLNSLLCVPVTSRTDSNLIALACVVNKNNGSRFTDSDVSCILQCFRYTATVLTSTLAFQKERRLKDQTQAMLQVARHLFANLGEFIHAYNQVLDDFPIVRSRMCSVDLYGNTSIIDDSNSCVTREFKRCTITEESAACQKMCVTCCKRVQHTQTLAEVTRQAHLADRLTSGACSTPVTAGYKVSPIVKSPDKKHKYFKEKVSRSTPYEVKERRRGESQELGDSSLSDPNICSDEYGADAFCDAEEPAGNHCTEPDTRGEKLTEGNESVDAEADDENSLHALGVYGEDNTLTDTEMAEAALSCSTSSSDSMVEYLSPVSDTESYNTAVESEAEASGVEKFFSSTVSQSLDVGRRCGASAADASIELDVSSGNEQGLSSPVILDIDCTSVTSNSQCSTLPDNRSTLDNAFLIPKSYSVIKAISREFGIDAPEFEDSQCSVEIQVDDTESGLSHSLSQQKLQDEPAEEGDNEESASGQSFSPSQCDVCGCHYALFSPSTQLIADMQSVATEARPTTDRDLTKLLREIMQQARNLSQAERCSVFLIDRETDELVAKVFDGITTKDNEVQEEIRLPISQGIAGHVATTGELLNIKDAYSHPLFYRGIDDSTGFRTRNILCFPIKDEKGEMLGVAQLCNKKTGPCFTKFDEESSTAFGIYCCISISHSLMYKKVIDSQVRSTLANELMMYHMECLIYKKLQDSQHRKSLANELMIYHMQVNQDDVHEMTRCEIPNPRLISNIFDEFHYSPRSLPENNTSLSCLAMFEDLGFLSRWRIRRDTLARFVLMVKKGYRNPPYHNWMHAYTVAHFCYLLVKNLKLEKYLDEIEIFALFVSCLCHDIDHRGTNNSFQVQSKSVLAALYSSEGSVLERHHFAQTMCILNTEGCNVFENLTSKEYQQALDLTREIILATDLAHHLKILKHLQSMADAGYDKTNAKNHKLLLCLLMTSCDLSDQTKPWENTKKVAALIYKEFFSQGDMEKSLGKNPIEMMDRERAQIPTLQINFLEHIATPVYRLLSELFDEAKPVVAAVQDNRHHWDNICTLIKMKRGGSSAKMTFDEVLAIETEDTSDNHAHQNGQQ